MAKRKHPHRKHRLLGKPQTGIDTNTQTESTAACIHKICYNTQALVAQQLTMHDIVDWQAPAGHVAWINVHGVLDIPLLQAVARRFKLHPLVLDDILNTEQRPKLDTYPDYLFLETRSRRRRQPAPQFHAHWNGHHHGNRECHISGHRYNPHAQDGKCP